VNGEHEVTRVRSGGFVTGASRRVRASWMPRPAILAALGQAQDREIDRWIRRMALLLVAGAVAFAGFYALDRWRPASPSIATRETAALEQAVRDDPSDVAARGGLADAYVAGGRYADAIAQYDAVIATGKADKLGRMGRAKARFALGQLDGAAEDYRAVVAMASDGEMANVDPLLEGAYYGLGEIALRQGRPSEAIDQLTAALNIKRADADALNLIGSAYVQTGQAGDAVRALRGAVAFVPIGWAEPYQTLEEAYAALGQPQNAEWAGAMADFASGDRKTAERRLLVIADGPAALDAIVGLGLINESRSDLAEASAWYRRALALDPTNATARLGLGRVGAADASAPGVDASSGTELPGLPTPGADAGVK